MIQDIPFQIYLFKILIAATIKIGTTRRAVMNIKNLRYKTVISLANIPIMVLYMRQV